jgi:hypothetical protein
MGPYTKRTLRRRGRPKRDEDYDERSLSTQEQVAAMMEEDDEIEEVEVEVDASEVDDDDNEGEDEAGGGGSKTSESKSAGRKRSRGPADEMKSLLVHFSPDGYKKGNKYVRCIYCVGNYEHQLLLYQQNKRNTIPSPGNSVRQRLPFLRRHLKKCPNYAAHVVRQATGLTGSAAPTAITAGTPASAGMATVSDMSLQTIGTVGSGAAGLHNYFLPALDNEQKEFLYNLILEFIVENALPFTVVERPSFKRMMDYLRPGVSSQLVQRKVMSDRVLDARFAEAIKRRDNKIKSFNDFGHYIALMVDGWETNTKATLEGVMLKAGPTSFLLTSVQPGTDHHALAVASMWENIISEHASNYISRLRYFLSDDAGQCARARRILALRHPHIMWTKCWAHQVNLMVGHLMSQSSFAKASDGAVKAAAAIRQSSSKWYARLRNICDRRYGKAAAHTIFTLAETRWNSLQAVFASQLRIRGACDLLCHEHNDDPRWPSALNVWQDKAFWNQLVEAELLIRPFCDASFLMQRDCT